MLNINHYPLKNIRYLTPNIKHHHPQIYQQPQQLQNTQNMIQKKEQFQSINSQLTGKSQRYNQINTSCQKYNNNPNDYQRSQSTPNQIGSIFEPKHQTVQKSKDLAESIVNYYTSKKLNNEVQAIDVKSQLSSKSQITDYQYNNKAFNYIDFQNSTAHKQYQDKGEKAQVQHFQNINSIETKDNQNIWKVYFILYTLFNPCLQERFFCIQKTLGEKIVRLENLTKQQQNASQIEQEIMNQNRELKEQLVEKNIQLEKYKETMLRMDKQLGDYEIQLKKLQQYINPSNKQDLVDKLMKQEKIIQKLVNQNKKLRTSRIDQNIVIQAQAKLEDAINILNIKQYEHSLLVSQSESLIPNEVSANHDIKLTNNTSGKKDQKCNKIELESSNQQKFLDNYDVSKSNISMNSSLSKQIQKNLERRGDKVL